MTNPLIKLVVGLFTMGVFAPAATHAQSLHDDFNGSAVNSSLWNVILPFSQSYITEANGYLTTGGRGTLATVNGFSHPLVVSGAVTLNHANEHFAATLRTDLSTNTSPGLGPYHVLTGISVGFNVDDGMVKIEQINSTDPNPPTLAITPFSFSVGTLYNFTITDDGTNLDLDINGTHVLSGSSTFATGNLIAFQSREFNYTSSSLDYVSIQGAIANGQLLHDSFNGTSIDTSLWQVSTPFPNSSMTESGGNAVFQNRGRLLSLASFPKSIDVTGSFEFTGNIHDQFEVTLRTNGASTNPPSGFDNGIKFDFAIESDTGSTANQIHIREDSYPNPEIELATGTFPMALNTFYTFRITDDGTNLALYINDFGHPLLVATDSNFYGSQLGLSNREGNGSISAGSVTQLDYIQVLPRTQPAYSANLSTRGFVGTGDTILIAGVIIGGGTDPAWVIVRGLGPSLTFNGVGNALADPTLVMVDRSGNTIASNDNWKDTSQASDLLAWGLAPANDAESAIEAILTPGAYTVLLRGKNDTTGVGLVEVYNLK